MKKKNNKENTHESNSASIEMGGEERDTNSEYFLLGKMNLTIILLIEKRWDIMGDILRCYPQ